MSLYLDTSCLLKLFFPEAESSRVATLIGDEKRVVVSSLTLVEFDVRLQRLKQERSLDAPTQGQIRRRLDALLGQPPFEPVEFLSEYFLLAQRQTRSAKSLYCKTLDRLHIAAMQALRIKRLLTNDNTQAIAAKAHGIFTILPR